MPRGSVYSTCVRSGNRIPTANGVAPCLLPQLRTVPLSRRISLINVEASSVGELCLPASTRGPGWSSCFTNSRRYRTPRPEHQSSCIRTQCVSGGIVGRAVNSPWPIKRAGVASPLFPPRDRAIVKAVACEAVSQTKLPLSRLSTSDLAERAATALSRSISPSTVWRILDTDAIKPWRYKYRIFPRDPKFSEKAGRVLDLYAGSWEGSRPGRREYIISSDEKTSIQARIRCHATLPTGLYFSIIQRKVLTPNDIASLEEVEQRLHLYEELSNQEPHPFDWKFDRAALLDFLERLDGKDGKLPAGLARQSSCRPAGHRCEPHS